MSSSSSTTCAACKLLGRECFGDCVFYPYFPADNPKGLILFSTLSKLLNKIHPSHREDVINSLIDDTRGRKHRITSLWNSMYKNSKKDLLMIRVSDLKEHFALLKGLESDLLQEALSFAEVNNNWNFWGCCNCSDKFTSSSVYMQHVAQKHIWKLTPETKNLLPRRISNEWTNLLLNRSWKPLDFSTVAAMIGNHNFQMDYHSVPTVDDTKRAKLLRRIQIQFEFLIRHEYLAASHVTKMIEFTMDELQSLVSGSQLLNQATFKNPMCICFLEAAELKEILLFLKKLSMDLNEHFENTVPLDDGHSANLEIKEKILLNGDDLYLILDELSIEDVNGLLSWIYAGASSGDQLSSWLRMKEEKTRLGMKIFKMLHNEFLYIEANCSRSCYYKRFQGALQTVEDLCREEDRNLGTKKPNLNSVQDYIKSGEDDVRRAKACLYKMDNFIKAVHRKKEQLSLTASKNDAQIMHKYSAIKKLEITFMSVCAQDYQSIMLLLVKSYLRAQLEDLGGKYGTKKSDAAREDKAVKRISAIAPDRNVEKQTRYDDGLSMGSGIRFRTEHDVTSQDVNETSMYGSGLLNKDGENNCFLNVIIQSLWHLRRFHDEFLQRSRLDRHVHVGDPCVVCALYEIFSALNIASTKALKEPVDPTSLRTALSNFYSKDKRFQQREMHDAAEVLNAVLDCLHLSFTSGPSVSDAPLNEDCANSACIVHSLFGMNKFERMNCHNCHLESRRHNYTCWCHDINASALRHMKVKSSRSSFPELLNLVERSEQIKLACDAEAGGCGARNPTLNSLLNSPHFFMTVIGWEKLRESPADITATLAALNTEIDISVLCDGLDLQTKHNLVAVVCYYGYHYLCFAYNHSHAKWVMYNDSTVDEIGDWDELLKVCQQRHLQPQVLFFEAVN